MGFSLPGDDSGEGDHQKEGPVQAVDVVQVGQEAYGLDGLPQPHLIREDY